MTKMKRKTEIKTLIEEEKLSKIAEEGIKRYYQQVEPQKATLIIPSKRTTLLVSKGTKLGDIKPKLERLGLYENNIEIIYKNERIQL